MKTQNALTAPQPPPIQKPGGGCLERLVRRRWLYTVTDWNDDESHVDENGEEVCRDDAKEHVATDAEAAIEADRRADLWETKQDALVAKVTRHSQGIVRETPNYLFRRKVFGLCAYWPRNAELLATALIMAQD
jgi:hypothetical protein